MENLKVEMKRVNLKLPKSLHQILLQHKARTYKSIQLLIEEAIRKTYKTF